jgi:hypothetical protein
LREIIDMKKQGRVPGAMQVSKVLVAALQMNAPAAGGGLAWSKQKCKSIYIQY